MNGVRLLSSIRVENQADAAGAKSTAVKKSQPQWNLTCGGKSDGLLDPVGPRRGGGPLGDVLTGVAERARPNN